MLDNKIPTVGQILKETLFGEPMGIETAQQSGSNTWVLGLVSMQPERFRQLTLNNPDPDSLTITEPDLHIQETTVYYTWGCRHMPLV